MLSAGTVVQGRYRVVRLLGQGGMGAVYQAWDERLKVSVALKELLPQSGLDMSLLEGLQKQFEQEASILARLHHPNLVRVTDYFEEQKRVYLVMDFVEGHSLAERIRRDGALPEALVKEWALQLLDALAYCHAQGVLHRDIKPQNIILKPDGRVVLVDFGLVKLWDPHDPRTKTVMRGMGTPEYAPPEQYSAAQDHTSPASDLYSLGATLYHALTGQVPPTATERMAVPERLVPLERMAPSVSRAMSEAVARSLALSMGNRWQNAAAMARFLRQQPVDRGETALAGAALEDANLAPTMVAQIPPPAVSSSATGGSRPGSDSLPSGPPAGQPGGPPQPEVPPGGGPPPGGGARSGPRGSRRRPLWFWLLAAVLLCGALTCIVLCVLGAFVDDEPAVTPPPLEITLEAVTPETDTPPPEDTATPEAVVGGFTIAVENQSPDEVCYVLISPSDSDSWGDDWLGGEGTIPSGATRGFAVAEGSYDVLAADCTQATMGTLWDVSQDATLTVGAPGATRGLWVYNGSGIEVCYIFIAPIKEEEWGEDWLGEQESFPPDDTRVFYVQPGIYDLMAADCEGEPLFEEYEVDLTEDIEWTLEFAEPQE